MTALLDTHIWIWWLTGDARLSTREHQALDRLAERSELGLSAISMWEAQVLHRKKRLVLPLPFSDWLELAADERTISVVPLDVAVVTAIETLPARFHGDPADRLIVATARARRLPLATRDAMIRRARVVSIWRP